jgi:hypothetical protein
VWMLVGRWFSRTKGFKRIIPCVGLKGDRPPTTSRGCLQGQSFLSDIPKRKQDCRRQAAEALVGRERIFPLFFYPRQSMAAELGNYTSLVAWSFLPGIVTDWPHKTYYSYRNAQNSPSKPKPHSDCYKLHNRRIYVLVILSYLAYSMFDVVTSLPSNHYALLSVNPADFSQREVR